MSNTGENDLVTRLLETERVCTRSLYFQSATIVREAIAHITATDARIAELERCKWEVKHTDTMNDIVQLEMARDCAHHECDKVILRAETAERERDELTEGPNFWMAQAENAKERISEMSRELRQAADHVLTVDAENESLRAQVVALIEALEPFAKLGDGGWGSSLPDDTVLVMRWDQEAKQRPHVTQGDLRHARATLDRIGK